MMTCCANVLDRVRDILLKCQGWRGSSSAMNPEAVHATDIYSSLVFGHTFSVFFFRSPPKCPLFPESNNL